MKSGLFQLKKNLRIHNLDPILHDTQELPIKNINIKFGYDESLPSATLKLPERQEKKTVPKRRPIKDPAKSVSPYRNKSSKRFDKSVKAITRAIGFAPNSKRSINRKLANIIDIYRSSVSKRRKVSP